MAGLAHHTKRQGNGHNPPHTRSKVVNKWVGWGGSESHPVKITETTHVIVRIVRESEQPATPRMCTHHHMTAMFITGPAVADAMPPCGVLSAGGR